ncbi:hypothetical protein [Shimwellia blattae]|uniref:hypothetical protein n=1 Tax=Shimwellia blattae TaxID=563 RepID=UPI0002918C57|nr:hypothetical protein [Shimwellia blattae]GAB80139.1 hypothetical protein EB105725_04_02500 [Shimwellia blattae DSM 4481 = NBRC 105725]VDY64028.1 Uncharacterised protein [Shimwellia blattae]VEC22163.1 Uncharacterised protein [Shimwellia blattae]
MKRSRFTDSQIIAILKQAESGAGKAGSIINVRGDNSVDTYRIPDSTSGFDGLQNGMIWCSVSQALRMAISSGGHNQYVGRSLKENGSLCRDDYSGNSGIQHHL